MAVRNADGSITGQPAPTRQEQQIADMQRKLNEFIRATPPAAPAPAAAGEAGEREHGIALDGAAQLLGLDIFAYTPGDVYRAIAELQAVALLHAGCVFDAQSNHDQGAADHGHAS